MSEEFLKQALGVVGTALQIGRAVPSTIEVLRTRRVDAGGAMGLDLLTVSGLWWVVYALEIDNYPTLIASAAGLLPAVFALLVLWRAGRLHRRGAMLLVAGVALIPIAIVSEWLAAGIATILGAVIAVPEAISLARDPARADEDVSVTMWLLIGVNAVVWLVYGIMIEHPVVGAAGVVQLPCVIVIFWRLARRPPVIQRGSPSAPR